MRLERCERSSARRDVRRRRPRSSPSFALGLLLAALACAEGSQPAPRPPNVLLITIDTLRADHLSAYGFRGHRTQNIDALAADGVLFERAVSDAPWTTASMSSVMTGTYPTRHGFKSTEVHTLRPEAITLAELLRAHGYATAAVIGSYPLDSVYGLDQGFDHYDDAFTHPVLPVAGKPIERIESQRFETVAATREFNERKLHNDSLRTDAEVTDAASAWLRDRSDAPFLLWVHYFGPHYKFVVERYDNERVKRRRLENYAPGVVANDAEVGRLLAEVDELGLRDSTLVVLHADHGESLMEHGYHGHGDKLYEPSMHIPLILRLPGRTPPGLRVPQLVRNIDIVPTVLEATGVPAGSPLDGSSLWPEIEGVASGGEPGRPRLAYMETYFPALMGFGLRVELESGIVEVPAVRRALRSQRWKFVRTEPTRQFSDDPPEITPAMAAAITSEELYDLRADPGEERDVLAAHPQVAARMRAALDGYREIERQSAEAPVRQLDPAERERLKQLGYLRD